MRIEGQFGHTSYFVGHFSPFLSLKPVCGTGMTDKALSHIAANPAQPRCRVGYRKRTVRSARAGPTTVRLSAGDEYTRRTDALSGRVSDIGCQEFRNLRRSREGTSGRMSASVIDTDVQFQAGSSYRGFGGRPAESGSR